MTDQHRRNHILARALSWFLLALTVLTMMFLLWLDQQGCHVLYDPTFAQPILAFSSLVTILPALAFVALGTLVNVFQPANRIGWLLSLFGYSFLLVTSSKAYGQCGLQGLAPLRGPEYAIWFGNNITAAWIGAFLVLLFVFPNGQFLTRRWRNFCLAGFGLMLVPYLLTLVKPGPMPVDSLGQTTTDNPVGLEMEGASWLVNGGSSLFEVLVFALLIGAVISLVLRWRRSRGEVRQQLKWPALQLGIAAPLFLIVENVGVAAYPAIFDGWFYVFVIEFLFLGMVVSIGLAVFKYRLYDIDIIIRRTLVYAILTGLLALVYFGSVTLLTSTFSRVSGQQSALAIVVSTLLIAALFTPLRKRIQDWIDRRFYRRKYDAQRVLAQFAIVARDETDLDTLTAELVRVVQETMQPEQVSVWLRETKTP